MISALADYARVIRAGWTLVRRDALIPREYAHLTPAPVRAFGALTRIGAKGKDERPGKRLAHAFERLGPAYVKLGQFMATRPDIIGFEMAADLGRLQDRMPPFSEGEARSLITPLDGEARLNSAITFVLSLFDNSAESLKEERDRASSPAFSINWRAFPAAICSPTRSRFRSKIFPSIEGVSVIGSFPPQERQAFQGRLFRQCSRRLFELRPKGFPRTLR